MPPKPRTCPPENMPVSNIETTKNMDQASKSTMIPEQKYIEAQIRYQVQSQVQAQMQACIQSHSLAQAQIQNQAQNIVLLLSQTHFHPVQPSPA
ncbi:hypothetical protein AYI69_g906 [Smittium culicis]|uniref:Uncharacterized protein n=1 Tax=Smittium culicis TaxID=133412 RepID=A0A1R1YRP6_9FUNG|nr:hypothetical protein AYI69_g906 [Smittium culicis]